MRSLTSDEALRYLRHGGTIKAATPDGLWFEIQSKFQHGLTWYRSFPARRGCLNRYSRLGDEQVRQWFDGLSLYAEEESCTAV